MEIAALPAFLTAVDTMNQINFAILGKSLDTIETMGDGMVKMLEQSVTPNLGQNIDISL